MNSVKAQLFVVLVSTILCGCAGLPRLAGDGAEALPPKVSDITTELQCEILEAVDRAKRGDSQLTPLALYGHVVSATITLQVENDQNIDPSLSFVHPIGSSGNNYTTLLSGRGYPPQTRN